MTNETCLPYVNILLAILLGVLYSEEENFIHITEEKTYIKCILCPSICAYACSSLQYFVPEIAFKTQEPTRASFGSVRTRSQHGGAAYPSGTCFVSYQSSSSDSSIFVTSVSFSKFPRMIFSSLCDSSVIPWFKATQRL
jgi:hypothetical protein